MILTTKWFGSFLCEEGKVRKTALFPKNAAEIAKRLSSMSKGEILPEERSLASGADVVADRRLVDLGKKVKFDSSFIKPEDYGYSLDIYREATIIMAKETVRKSVGPDVHLGQAVRAYDELLYTTNVISERLREWYGLHFPELEVVTTPEAYARVIEEAGSRADVMRALSLHMDSIGSDVEQDDLDSIRILAHALNESYSERSKLEKYIEVRMKQVAPNVSSLAGPVVGARLIMQAGSLKRLASMPAGTVQLLGAEKSMFRHLKKGSRPPKHGIIFTHPLVHNAPTWQRGPIARALAAKICIAARADAYSRADVSTSLKEQVDKRVEEIKKQRVSPPKRAPETPSRKKKRYRR